MLGMLLGSVSTASTPHYKWPALPQFSVKTAPDSILGQQIFKLFLVHALRPPSKLGQHSAKPPLHIFKFATMVMLTITTLMKNQVSHPLDLFLDQCLEFFNV